jgi:hypothetical protein
VHFFGPNVTYSLVRPYKDIGLGLGQLPFLRIDHWHTGVGLALNNIFGLCFGFGYEFVNVLIFVSGLSLAMTLSGNAIVWVSWLRRRIARVLIPYYAVCIPLLLALEAFRIVADHVKKPALDAVYTKLSQQTATNPFELFGSHIFLIDPLRPQFVTQFFSPAWWFIPAIIVAYLSFPLFLSITRKMSPLLLLPIAAGVSICAYILCQKGVLLDNAWYFIVLNECFAFVAGIIIGTALKTPSFLATFERRMASLPAVFLSAVLFCAGNVCNWYHVSFPEASLLFTTGCTLLSCWLAIRLQSFALIRKICEPDAYYLYLCHQPLAFPLALIASRSHLQFMPCLAGVVYIAIATVVASALARLAGMMPQRRRQSA